jgi:hypothetical protein
MTSNDAPVPASDQPAGTTDELWIEDDAAPAGDDTGEPGIAVPAVAPAPGVTGGAVAPAAVPAATLAAAVAAGSAADSPAEENREADADEAPYAGRDGDR